MEIQGKVALITGAASGLGAATAEALLKAGAKLALLDSQFKLDPDVSDRVIKLNCDVANTKSVELAIGTVVQHYAAIHILVNCAGIAPAARMVAKSGVMPLADFHRVLHVNLLGTFDVMRLVAAQISTQALLADENERGVIINTASVAAFEGQIGQVAYSASKAGVAAMTLPAARELARFAIRVMTIAPGVMATPMVNTMPAELQQKLASDVPFPPRLGDAKEHAALVEHIVRNSYLNGEVIRLDGALRLGTS